MKTDKSLRKDRLFSTERLLSSRFYGVLVFPSFRVRGRGLLLTAALLVILSFLSPGFSLLVISSPGQIGSMAGFVPAFDFGAAVAFAEEYPRPVGFVNDFADVIPGDIRAKLAAIAAELEQKTGAEIVVVTVRTTGNIDIHGYSVELFTRWGIGKKGQDNGLLVIAAIDDRQMWIKTGYGLEETIPDAVASQVYRNILRPSFIKGEYGQGLLATVQVLAERIAGHAGVKLTSLDGLPPVPQDEVSRKSTSPFVPLAFAFGVFILLIVARISGGPRSRRHGGFPFWTIGGFSGGTKGGGFGGGFGGFGGGSCGGGGAGGGW